MRIATPALLLMMAACSSSRPAPSPPPAAPRAESAATPERVALDLAAALQRRDFAAAGARFDDRMRAALPADRLQEAWDGLVAQAGPLQAIEGTRRADEQGYAIVLVALRFQAAHLDMRVVQDDSRHVAGLFFVHHAPGPRTDAGAPPYARPDAYEERGVEVKGLPGTLTVPSRPPPWPAVVLVHGSGPSDRDEAVGGARPFRDLALGLATRGIAVLRHDKRTLVQGAKLAAAPITVKEEAIDDALAAADLLRHVPGVDRVFVLGHSLGGTLAPDIARADGRLAGVIVLAGATRPLPDLMVEQLTYLARLDGTLDAAEQRRIDEARAAAARIRDGSLGPGESVLGATASYWRDLAGRDPVASAAALAIPLLVLQGGRDYQVTGADLQRWRSGLAGRQNATIKVYPALDHLFRSGEGPSTPAQYEAAGFVDASVIEDVAAFVLSPHPGADFTGSPR